MEVDQKVDAYFIKQAQWKEGMIQLRKALLDLGLKEEVKWGAPTYTFDGKNIVGISGFNNHFGLWFFQGVFLSDPHKLLVNAQEGKTVAMRQIKFSDVSEVDIEILIPYFKEAIKNHKKGKKVKVVRKSKEFEMPELLKGALDKKGLKIFNALSTSKQNEFKEYILMAKREATKISRVEKILLMILQGIGLNDKYK